MKILVCSTNAGKIRDFQLAASQAGVAIEALPGLRDIAPPEETGSTFEENAVLKAIYYSHFTPGLVLADDSGLVVDGLGGEPGVYSARYAGPDATDEQNNALLLEKLKHVINRHARFVCAIALAQSAALITTVEGSVSGEIADEPKGNEGFGYDPLFLYRPLERTFGQLAPEEKFAISHRGNAARALADFLKRH